MPLVGEQCEFPIKSKDMRLEIESNEVVIKLKLDSTIISTLSWLLSEKQNLKIIIEGIS